ncbi:dienelactone hydrolase family protein [Actinomadura fibrosa]|uniref:Poly(ethylene terephthalate) hydrolase n=1 Tax=Actinomadura fibrosa TaxID=111802 RepID=A0ABW2XQE4_9ACTN|nr:alpha/beta hydrolase [Actinomadura fibrosa]
MSTVLCRRSRLTGRTRRLAATALAAALATTLATAAAPAAAATTAAAPAAAVRADSPYQRGPAPTEASVTAARGPFAIAQVTVPAGSGTGFNKGTIYYPTDTGQGTFGGVAVMPGFTSPQSVIQWLGPRLASQGFLVFTLDSLSLVDFPTARSQQLLAALDYLATRSTVRTRLDPNRLAVMGHSMGGGASLWAAQNRPSLKASVPLAPWETDTTWQGVRVPTMIIGGQADTVAPPATMAIPDYTSMTSAPEKAYLELRNGGHGAPATESPTVAKYALSWLKRFVDLDTRYDQFLCPAPAPTTAISQYRDTCPNG